MKVFIDESGNHNMNYVNNLDPYNIFVLGAVVINDLEYNKFDIEFKKIKKELFGTEEIIIHTLEITRPSRSKNELNLLFNNPDFRFQFYTKMNDLIEKTDFKIVISIIKKSDFKISESFNFRDPYMFSFYSLMDKIIFHSKKSKVTIFPEKRGYQEDILLKSEFLNILALGTRRFKGSVVDQIVDEFTLKDKSGNTSGMQLIDLLVTPIGRHFLGKKEKPLGNEISYDIIKTKLDDKDFFVYP